MDYTERQANCRSSSTLSVQVLSWVDWSSELLYYSVWFVVAYSPIVGWIALGFTGFFGVIMVTAILNQVPWPWQNNTPQPVRQRTV